jgi:hypothetical protein
MGQKERPKTNSFPHDTTGRVSCIEQVKHIISMQLISLPNRFFHFMLNTDIVLSGFYYFILFRGVIGEEVCFRPILLSRGVMGEGVCLDKTISVFNIKWKNLFGSEISCIEMICFTCSMHETPLLTKFIVLKRSGSNKYIEAYSHCTPT